MIPRRSCWLILLLNLLNVQSLLDASWWSTVAQLSTALAGHNVKPVCELPGLSPGQAQVCELFKDHMPAVSIGAQNAIQECQRQFTGHRWNCSTHYSTGMLGPIHKMATREAAFTYAILSAGVTHEIGRRCKQGLLTSCGCSDETKPKNVPTDWSWGGCGDNVEYGYKFSRDFIDIREKEHDPKRNHDNGRSLMNRRNNEAGRKILKRHRKPKCKCHGVSGACNMKTCWMQLPSMEQVGKILRNKYDKAIRVQINDRGNLQLLADEATKERKTRALPTDLVFMDDSPDYCRFDRHSGTLGTEGRVCKRGSGGAEGCDSLCCGRGYNTYTQEVKSKCNCKFEWCCKVEFDQRFKKEMCTQDEECSAPGGDKGKEKEEHTVVPRGKEEKEKKPGTKPSPISPAFKGTPKERPNCGKTKNETSGKKLRSNDVSPDVKDRLQLSEHGPSKTCIKDFQWLEDFITKMPCFHGFIGREDLMSVLKNVGDFLIRTSVQPNKHEVEKMKKNQADVKVLGNLSREKCAKKEKEKEEKLAGMGDVGRREFVISVYCKDKEKPATDKPQYTPIRNLVIKRDNGMVHVEPLRKFKTLTEFFGYYQKNSGICKETDFQLITPIPLSNWEFIHEDIALQQKKLGEGAFGEVRIGKMKLKSTKKTVEVAVKMLRNAEVVIREQVGELLHEARVMRMMDHKNVLRSYGIAVLKEPLYLMTEMCACGALREYLRENQETVTLAEKLFFVVGSSRGVQYLHSQKTIHRDLAVRNILLSEDRTPKISDFGLAKISERYEMKEQCKIPVRYLAPETLESFIFTTKTDVFSFGCVIWEIYENGNQPHDGKNAQTIRNLTKKNQFLKLTNSAPSELRKLIEERVFTSDPENRCSMTTIVQCAEKIEKPPVGMK